jgi:hypothetical protein
MGKIFYEVHILALILQKNSENTRFLLSFIVIGESNHTGLYHVVHISMASGRVEDAKVTNI